MRDFTFVVMTSSSNKATPTPDTTEGRRPKTNSRPSGELVDSLARKVLEGTVRAKGHIENARQEIEDGGRPRKGRFSL